jgi:PPOX class probable F420-dependent enzyme
MLTSNTGLPKALDSAIIGFLTAVNGHGQPQTSPVWYIRDGEDLVVYNRPTAARLRSIVGNSRIAFNLRADRRAMSGISLEGTAVVDSDLPPAVDFPGYVDRYGEEIARLGWTPESFSTDYSVGLRITVTRVRNWGVEKLNAGELG